MCDLEGLVRQLASKNNEITEQNKVLMNELMKCREHERNFESIIMNALMYFVSNNAGYGQQS